MMETFRYRPWMGALAALLVITGIATYAFLHPVAKPSAQTSELPATSVGIVSPTNAAGVPAGMRSYTNQTLKFTFFFPQAYIYTEYHEQNGGFTAVFHLEDGTNGGFQVYVVPYSDTQITGARFKLDEPSGIRTDVKYITIDGQPATMFYSENSAMGATREVWFIHGGYLYEVTTYKELDAMLSEVMATWKFL